MTHAEILAHLKSAHGLETKGLKCNKRMIRHMDGDTWFSWQYEVSIEVDGGKIELINETITPRSKDDMMRYA